MFEFEKLNVYRRLKIFNASIRQFIKAQNQTVPPTISSGVHPINQPSYLLSDLFRIACADMKNTVRQRSS